MIYLWESWVNFAPLAFVTRLRTFESLQYRDFRLLWLGHTGNSVGQWMDMVARGWLMYELTNSPLELGLVNTVRAVPLLFFSVVAGSLADRYGQKVQLVGAQAINAGLNLTVAILVLSGHIAPWHVYVTGFCAGIVMAFQNPARQSLIPELVDKRHLINAIGLNSMAFNSSRTVAPAVAGVLIASVGVGNSYLVQALIYAFSTVWTIQMRLPAHIQAQTHAPRTESFLSATADGFRYIAHDRIIRSVMLIALVPAFFGQPYASMMPVFARDLLQVGPQGQGMMFTATGMGALVSALSMATIPNFRRRGLVALVGAVAFGTALVGFAASRLFPLSLGLLAIIGACNVSYGAIANTIVQSYTPTEYRGRVMGIYFLNPGLVSLGSLLAGTLASVIGAAGTVAIMGLACALLAGGVGVFASELRRVD
jgi:MFS family permease